MTPTADDFMALARSSPWLWRTLHFTHRSGHLGEVEAWLRRPGRLMVRTADGTEHRVYEAPRQVAPQDVEPLRRPDGLVAERPDGAEIAYDDPMWQSYSWVAMLDPVELSRDVDVRDVRVGERSGRTTWEARMTATGDYEPRCGCCSLLTSRTVDRLEWDDDFVSRRHYPDHHEVALDRQTGVVVRCLPVGGADLPWLEVDIHEVDADLDTLFVSDRRRP